MCIHLIAVIKIRSKYRNNGSVGLLQHYQIYSCTHQFSILGMYNQTPTQHTCVPSQIDIDYASTCFKGLYLEKYLRCDINTPLDAICKFITQDCLSSLVRTDHVLFM